MMQEQYYMSPYGSQGPYHPISSQETMKRQEAILLSEIPSTTTLLSPWRTGIWARFPWPGFLALVSSLAASVSMLIILARSNGKAADWTISPSVLLAIAAAIANLSLRYALNEGVPVAWWTKALKPRTKLKDLHNIWAFGTQFLDALFAGPAVNLVAIACIIVALTPINGPLLQRASSFGSHKFIEPITLNIPVAQQFPDGYTGRVTNRARSVNLLTTEFSTIVKNYDNRVSINLTNSGCVGRCSGVLQAAGYSISCVSSLAPFNYSAQTLTGNQGTTNWTQIFTSNFIYSERSFGPLTINYSSAYKNNDQCAGDLHVTNCTLSPALLQQRIVLVNNSLLLDPAYTYESDVTVSLITDVSRVVMTGGSTHGGMALMLATRYNSMVESNFDGVYGYQYSAEGAPAFEYMKSGLNSSDTYGTCAANWADPTPDMLAVARQVAFRVAIASANLTNATNIQPLMEGVRERDILVYQSHFKFAGAAVALTFLAVCAVIPIFSGWWKLGRTVSMSPVEITKAFNAKLLESTDSNAEIRSLLQEVGSRGVQYGIMDSEIDRTRTHYGRKMLAMGYPTDVRPPA